ncbi:hypothetical protein [Streptomyces sp. ISL-100]|uniref:hypothetical protein n=1 Tax=Streptomyces sp. ISL-100 TaxID=2819173 RepID=UPI001BEB8CA4|nr:hypothetical protein [Streptomyces sp. ISL-100]MBT2398197.1 hypothetical protein [Streptomyces sp. ISL-100]
MKRALATLVAVLCLMVPLVGASAGTGIEVPTELDRTAGAIASAKRQGTLVVRVEQRLALGEGDVQQGMQRVVDAKKKHDVDLVVVQTGRDSGPGGAVLLLLADARAVPEDARISTLPDKVLRAAQDLKLCAHRGKLCQLLNQSSGQQNRTKEAGLPKAVPRMARDERAALEMAGHSMDIEPHRILFPSGEGADGTGIGPAGMVLLTLLAAGTALFVLTVLRTRYVPGSVAGRARAARSAPAAGPVPAFRPAGIAGPVPALPQRPPRRSWPTYPAQPGPGGPRAEPDGPVRPATVRTRLHPQGYVELDGWLYRASWVEPYLDPPDPDATVDVTDRRPGILLAYAPGDSRTDSRA